MHPVADDAAAAAELSTRVKDHIPAVPAPEIVEHNTDHIPTPAAAVAAVAVAVECMVAETEDVADAAGDDLCSTPHRLRPPETRHRHHRPQP